MSSITEVMFSSDLPCNDWGELEKCPLKDMSQSDGQIICHECGNGLYINQEQVQLTEDDVFGRLNSEP